MTPAQNALAHLKAALQDIQQLSPAPDSTPGPLETAISGAAYSVLTDLQDAIAWCQKCIDLGG